MKHLSNWLITRPTSLICLVMTIVLCVSCNGEDEEVPLSIVVASFESEVNESNSLTYNFINTSLVDGSNEGDFTSSWDFGGDGSSTGKNPSHTFSSEGTYEVTLTITAADGEVDIETNTVNIELSLSTPIAGFIANEELSQELTFSFTNTSVMNDITDTSFTSLWDFGGDGTSTEESPTHTFSAAGVYDVTLTVTAADGEMDIETKTVVVELTVSAPIAGFIANEVLNQELTFSFTNTSVITDIPNTSFASYWDFGGDGTSIVESPTHTFSAVGDYDVTLTVTAADGEVDAITQTIEVRAITNQYASITDSQDDDTGELRLTVDLIQSGRLSFMYRVAEGAEMNISDAFIMVSGNSASGDFSVTEIRLKDDAPHLFREGASDETIISANFPEGVPNVWVPIEISWNADGSTAPIYSVTIGGQSVVTDAISTTNGGPGDVDDHLAAVVDGAGIFMWRYNSNSATSDGVYHVDNIVVYSSDSGTETIVFEDNFEGWQFSENLNPIFNANSLFHENTVDATVGADW